MICCNIAVVDIGGTNIKYGFLPAAPKKRQPMRIWAAPP